MGQIVLPLQGTKAGSRTCDAWCPVWPLGRGVTPGDVCAAALGRFVPWVGLEGVVTCHQGLQMCHPGPPKDLPLFPSPVEVVARLKLQGLQGQGVQAARLGVLGCSSCPSWGGLPGFLLTSFPPLQVVQRIKAVETETRLLVVDKETDEYLCSLRLTCTEEMVHSGVLLGSGVSPTKSVGSDNGEVWKPQLDLSGGSLQRHSHSFSSHGSRKVSAELVGLGGRIFLPWDEHGLLPMRKTFWMWLLGLGTLLCVLELWVSCPMASSALLEAASAVGAVLASPSLHSWRVTGVAGVRGGPPALGVSVPWGLAEVCVPGPWGQAARTGGLVELPLLPVISRREGTSGRTCSQLFLL